MTTNHTPGPWKVGQYLGSLRQFVIHMDVGDIGRGSDVAFTSAAFGNDETIANARLIAAAPDLLEALQQYGIGFADEAAARAEFGDYEVDRELRRRAAIAKATGEHP